MTASVSTNSSKPHGEMVGGLLDVASDHSDRSFPRNVTCSVADQSFEFSIAFWYSLTERSASERIAPTSVDAVMKLNP